jgi:hypothetical protein
MTDTLLVRLKPYDPRRGHVLRRYMRIPLETDHRFRLKPITDSD